MKATMPKTEIASPELKTDSIASTEKQHEVLLPCSDKKLLLRESEWVCYQSDLSLEKIIGKTKSLDGREALAHKKDSDFQERLVLEIPIVPSDAEIKIGKNTTLSYAMVIRAMMASEVKDGSFHMIYLDGYKLNSLPFYFINYLFQTHFINLHGNHLTALPEFFSHSCVKTLILSDNQFLDIPKEIYQLSCLKILNLGRNNISTFKVEGALRHIKILNLSANPIEALPTNIGDMKNLKELILCECKELKTLPESLLYLPYLETINLTKSVRKLDEPSKAVIEKLEAKGVKIIGY